MAIIWNKIIPRWGGDTIEPPEAKKDTGYIAGDKPPAKWENWLRKGTYEALDETRDVIEGIDSQLAQKLNTEDATVTSTANKVILRDSAGRAKIATPSASTDIANKAYVDSVAGGTGGVPTTRTITAGNGLSGGGDLSANRTITLGTPGTLTGSTTNSATSTSHTHAVTFPVSSVAGKTGAVTLNASDITYIEAGTTTTANTTLGSSTSVGASNSNTLVGRAAAGSGGSVAVGINTSAASFGTAIGNGAQANGTYSAAIGRLATASNASQGVLGSTGSTPSAWLVPGSFSVSGTKNFEIPHPHPDKIATHVLRHGAVESPTAGDTLYRYTVTATNDGDTVEIQLPDYFEYLNKDVDVWVNGFKHFGRAFGEVEGALLKVTCEKSGVYKCLVIGTRKDEHESITNWHIKGVEREIGESWMGETYVFEVEEIIEIDEITEVA